MDKNKLPITWMDYEALEAEKKWRDNHPLNPNRIVLPIKRTNGQSTREDNK